MLDSLINKLESYVDVQITGWTLMRRSQKEVDALNSAEAFTVHKYEVLVYYIAYTIKPYLWGASTLAGALAEAVLALQKGEEK